MTKIIRKRQPRVTLEQEGYKLAWYSPGDPTPCKFIERITSLDDIIYHLEEDTQQYKAYNNVQALSDYIYEVEVPIEFWIKVESLRSEEEAGGRMSDKIRLTITKGTLYPYHVYWSGFAGLWDSCPAKVRECLATNTRIHSILDIRRQIDILYKYYPDRIEIPFEQMLQLEKWE